MLIMSGRLFLGNQPSEQPIAQPSPQLSLRQAQDLLYDHFLELVKVWEPPSVIQEINQVFVIGNSSTSSEVTQALHKILFDQTETDFRLTLKRCLYIIINNWYAQRHSKFIDDLIQVFEDFGKTQASLTESPSLKILRQWLGKFTSSSDYQDIKLYVSGHQTEEDSNWTRRYNSYLLVSQYIEPRNPEEQRQAAKSLAKRLKDQLKFDLAMYTARCEAPGTEQPPRNPTKLGNEVVHLIKTIISKQRVLSYAHQAELFTQQYQGLTYEKFKKALMNYLMFSMSADHTHQMLKSKLYQKLEPLYRKYNQEIIDKDLLLRTCNRLIECMTTENGKQPARLFITLVNEKHTLILVIFLLKIILICQYSRTHLEVCIAQLIRYYEDYPEDECQWLINFLEIFNLVFAITADNVQYDLVRVKNEAPDSQLIELDAYRVFSQFKAADLRGRDLSGKDLTESNFTFAKLSDTNLSQSKLQGNQLVDADLKGANLKGSDLKEADLRRADLQTTNLSYANLTMANLKQADLREANLTVAKLFAANFTLANLTQADLRYSDLRKANLTDSNFSEANLSHADLREADLSRAKFYNANLSHSQFYRAIMTDVNLLGVDLTRANLNQAELMYSNLISANLSHALLRRCDLSHARLSHSNFHKADLDRANLSYADLRDADLSYAILRNANLEHANLSRANLIGANLFRINLKNAIVEGTRFSHHSGLAEPTMILLRERGAIFTDETYSLRE